MNKNLYELFLERERNKYEAKNFLDIHKDANGEISQEYAEEFEEKFGRVKNALDYQIEKEMDKPTSNPVLLNPATGFSQFGGSNNAGKTFARMG